MTQIERLMNLAGRYSDSKAKLAVTNPANDEILAEIPVVGEAGIRKAIDKAEETFKSWRDTHCDERGMLLRKAADTMLTRKEELGRLMTLEQGKPLKEAMAEIEYAASFLQWYSEEARRIRGELQQLSNSKQMLVYREPIGVTAAITPWNFPSAMITRKAGAAVAAGCSMIVKPAPETPLSAFAILDIFEEVGAPQGLLSVIYADAEIFARHIMNDSRIKKVSFTGSTEVGHILMRQAADQLKKLTLELGGNAPYIVFDDADIDHAVSEAIFGKFRNAGQACTVVNRFYLQNRIKPQFIEKYVKAISGYKSGDGLKDSSDIGPLINDDAIEKVTRLLKDAVAKGARIALGEIPSGKNRFINPIVLDNASTSMGVSCEEIFGPVAVMYGFESEDEVIRLANNTNYGLASYLFTNDLKRAHRVMSRLEYGMVGLNDVRIQLVHAPFGGIKSSGFGREGGREGIEEYLNLKFVSMVI